MPSLKEVLELWKIIDERLSSSELQTCKSLFHYLMSNRRKRNQVHKSLGRLLKKDDYLHQRFTRLYPYTDNQDGKIKEKIKRKVEGDCETPSTLEEARELWKIMDKRLSSSEVKTCRSLLEVLKSHGRERNQIHTYLGRLFKKDKYLHQSFIQLFPYSDYDKDGQTQEDTDIEEGEIREQNQNLPDDDDPKIHQAVAISNDEIRVTNVSRVSETALNDKYNLMNVDTSGGKILTQEDTDMEAEIREEDQHILRDDPKLYHRSVANHKIRVTNVTPSYRLLKWPEEEKECTVSERALNNECVLMKIDTCGGKILTGRERIMAKCEDEMFHADLLIENLRSAVESVEKVMSGEMRMENLGARFYKCVKEILRRRQDTVNETALPGVLTQLKDKLDKLIVARESKKPGWKKVFKENSAKQRQRRN